ncbi:MAG: hypothetical protein LWX09_01725 [Bacteroidia bacterium]|jgi:hypothetical protein|nr:hypothetical protein [Bacteroidia bacterium]
MIKRSKGIIYLTLLTLLAGVALSFTSCGFYFRTRLFEEHDVVKNTLRFRQEYYFNEVKERRTPFLGLQKTMLKEVAPDGKEILRVYDRLSLSLGSFKPERTVFLIIDGKVYPFEGLDPEHDISTQISEDRKDVLTADSTRVSVVTGYSATQSRLVRYNYNITHEVMDNMMNAKEIAFRYYAGPAMMTVQVGPKNLKNFRKLINAR